MGTISNPNLCISVLQKLGRHFASSAVFQVRTAPSAPAPCNAGEPKIGPAEPGPSFDAFLTHRTLEKRCQMHFLGPGKKVTYGFFLPTKFGK